MKVSELAKEFKVPVKNVLEKLKSMKMKAKDGNQELSKALVIVLKSELIKDMKVASRKKVEEAVRPRRRIIKSVEPKEDSAEPKKEDAQDKKVKTEEKEPADDKKKLDEKKKDEEPAVEVKETSKEEPEESVGSADSEQSEEPKAVESEAPQEEKKKQEKSQKASPKRAQKEAAKKKKEDSFQDVHKKGKFKKSSAQPFIALKPFNKKKKKNLKSSDADSHADEAAVPVANVFADIPEEELKPLEIKVPISVKDFANVIGQKTSVVLQTLIRMKIFANINQTLDEDVVEALAKAFGHAYVQVKTQEEQLIDFHREEEEDEGRLTARAPVITFMGHVDHGKTSLLDRIRKSKVVDQEHGGITQHIGAYSVKTEKGKITFLDTPGHEAFTAMRARGAHITDLIVVVIAADEGIMPQTEEAIAHARAAEVPIVVALNKMDRPGADPDKVKKQLMEHGLTAEDWGGDTIVAPVSAETGEGIDSLLELILLESEMLELKVNKDKKASGIVVEAHLSPGRGPVVTMIVQSGTLRLNDYIVVGQYYGKVKAMFDDSGRRLEKAGPSTPVEILGLMGVPVAGAMFYAVDDERKAKEIADRRQAQMKDHRLGAQKRVTLEDLYSQIQEGTVQELSVILKADVQGSLEALRDSLAKIPSDEVKVRFIHLGVGDINASDVILAMASNAIIIGFHIGIGPRAAQELEKTPVDVRQYNIIYDAVNDVKQSLAGLLAPKVTRKFLGRIEVRQVFKLSKAGMVAGSFVLKGKAKRKDKVDVLRNDEVVYSGQIATLKRFKDDVKEVNEGYECGLTLDKFDSLEEGDIVEVYEEETTARTIA